MRPPPAAGPGRARGYHPAIGAPPAGRDRRSGPWTFITNHGFVLLAIARDPEIRLRDVAREAGITERAVQRIVADLVDEGYLTRSRSGRRNVYELHEEMHLRHPTTRHQAVGALMAVLMATPGPFLVPVTSVE